MLKQKIRSNLILGLMNRSPLLKSFYRLPIPFVNIYKTRLLRYNMAKRVRRIKHLNRKNRRVSRRSKSNFKNLREEVEELDNKVNFLGKGIRKEGEEVEAWVLQRRKFLIKLAWLVGLIAVLLVISNFLIPK